MRLGQVDRKMAFPLLSFRLLLSLLHEDRMRIGQATKKAGLSLVSALAFAYLCHERPRHPEMSLQNSRYEKERLRSTEGHCH